MQPFKMRVLPYLSTSGHPGIGALQVRSTKTNAYTERDMGTIEQVGHQIAPAIENAHLYGRLKEGQERLRNLSKKLIEVQEDERHQLALELHDEVGQILTGLKLALEITPNLPAAKAKSKIVEATSLITGITRSTSSATRRTTRLDMRVSRRPVRACSMRSRPMIGLQ